MTQFFRPQNSFLQNTAWQNQALNALHYATSQQGSVLPLIYGTMRVQMNLIDMNNYRGPTGKKGKTGSLPISGTSRSGKGSGSSKGKGSKKNQHYSIDVDFAVCQGPVTFNAGNAVFSSSGVESFGSSQLNFYAGADGQTPDAHFNQVGYSGTCHVTGTPIDLGQSPVLPNIAFEITGILTNVHTGGYNLDANPADVVTDFLTNKRYGAGFPSQCLSQLTHDDSGGITNTYGDYCQAASLLVGVMLDGHQKAIEWLNGLVTLTNSALVWSGKLLKVIPYGDLDLNNNGASWSPNWTAQYDLTDRDFLPSNPHQDGSEPSPGDDDPIIVTRTNPADADNWVSIEYIDRKNFYNSTIITAFDQGAIDTYGLRIGDSLPGRAFTNPTSAQTALQLILQRRLYIRNTGIKFNLGWQFALLEPMDLVSISGRLGDNYLDKYIVRVTSIEENDNGDLAFVCEDPQPGISYTPPFIPAVLHGDPSFSTRSSFWYEFYYNGSLEPTDPAYDSMYDFRSNYPPNSSKGTFSIWVAIDSDHRPLPPGTIGPPIDTGTTSGDIFGLFQTHHEFGLPGITSQQAVCLDYEGKVFVSYNSVVQFASPTGVIRFDETWHHILVTWNLPDSTRVWVDGIEMENTVSDPVFPETINYSDLLSMIFFSLVTGLPGDWYLGCSNDLWWDSQTNVEDPGRFWNYGTVPKDLGFRGERPIGRPPNVFLHYPPGLSGIHSTPDNQLPALPGMGYYGINRAGYRCDDGAYWASVNNPGGATTGPGSQANYYCDPAHPNFTSGGSQPIVCNFPFPAYR